MNDLNVIDRFLQTFIRYIDSGFGLLGGDVAFLTTTLIGIDITLAGLFWAMGGEQDVIGRFLRKILYVGAFAFILNRFSTLADIIFRSFAAAGLTAGGGTLSADDLLKPGRLAGTGFSAAWQLLDQVAKLMGFTSFFDHFLTIIVLLFAWAIVIIAFFILAVQMFVCIVEFKLTTLAGFVLVPFALWNRTSFLAERVLGNVVSSGIKVMVLAVIVGIGSNFFSEFTTALQGQEPDIAQAMSLVLASLTLFGLGIFGPGIASGLVSGAPQLGAGAALGTAVGAAGITMLAGGATIGAARAVGGAALGAIRAGTTMGSAASASYQLGQTAAGSSSVGAGIGGMAQAAAGAARQKASAALGLGEAAERGRDAAWSALNGGANSNGSSSGGAVDGAPPWARSLRRQQDARHHRHVAMQTLKEGDRGGVSATPDIKERED
ncbi:MULTISPECIES: P-type conjugative transfer protein TrbL [unclassified Sphingobium]|uniref:P-type conjugative transfer protein TrbL n=1 Tax=unclassified Sphingobium TaxID=2611147 RepID=UPI000D16AD83|nr:MULTISPECIES: P-type conjugative transfer protein TrbL [unclassified Sphingobium]MBG6118178.1 type IV secretion system protein TrbL [Sphingobium sp. JAI105]PSO09991.1 P-type conjugative transfer protein TrbL [Sphingobium sp. AEW4]TWC98321.1 type IV secretion system protein TrbL [Sphingobium sp. AEW010]TWD18267.1 type IV secretion system protein TrbL [Sphingobium sp. AEW013]TWD20818.1 type IV secretion system protein TrbL [Sphingobium sp. AEW001]